jgi:hypothetical protein
LRGANPPHASAKKSTSPDYLNRQSSIGWGGRALQARWQTTVALGSLAGQVQLCVLPVLKQVPWQRVPPLPSKLVTVLVAPPALRCLDFASAAVPTSTRHAMVAAVIPAIR